MFKKRKQKSKEDAVTVEEKLHENQTPDLVSDCSLLVDGDGAETDQVDGFDSQGFVDLTPERQATLLGPKQPCQYIGTFAVSLGSSEDGEATLITHKERTKFVKKKLKDYRYSQKGVLVSLLISSDGIKVVSPDTKRVKMAHALQRISFATCDPDFRLFAYMSHNPSPLGATIHCHVFMTRYTRQVQNLTALFGKAFQMAFSQSKFPKGTELKMEPLKTSPAAENGAQGRKWARVEAQQGHEHSQHAVLARFKRDQEKNGGKKTPDTSTEQAAPARPKSTPAAQPAGRQRSFGKVSTPPELRKANLSEDSGKTSTQETKPLPHDTVTDGSPVTKKKEFKPSSTPQEKSSSPKSAHRIGAHADLIASSATPPLPPKQRSLDEDPASPWVGMARERSQTPPPSRMDGESAVVAQFQNRSTSPLVKAASDPNLLAEKNKVSNGQHETVAKQNSLEDEHWYMAGIPREFVTEMLEKSEEGSFFVRDSQSRPGCYALTMRVPSDASPTGFGNFLIMKVKDGVMIQGCDKVLPDLPSLVEHFSKNSDGLPCRLLIAESNVLCEDEDYVNTPSFDPDYQNLFDFTTMMAELN